jgi:hypothetical protein
VSDHTVERKTDRGRRTARFAVMTVEGREVFTATVSVQLRREGERVVVNWPSIGSVDADTAYAASIALSRAATFALEGVL